MKKLKKLKLNSIGNSNLKDREMSRIYGGNNCHFDNYNRDANEESGKCSCSCGYYTDHSDYYAGLDKTAHFFKDTTAWTYC